MKTAKRGFIPLEYVLSTWNMFSRGLFLQNCQEGDFAIGGFLTFLKEDLNSGSTMIAHISFS